MKRYRLPVVALVAALLVIGAASLHFYRMGEGQKKIDTVRLADGQNSIYKLPHYLAADKNFYGLHNIRIKAVECRDDRMALAALENGEADIALVSPHYLVLRKSSSLKTGATHVAFAALDRGTAYHLVSRDNVPLDDVKSIKGKTVIAGPPNSDETVFLEYLIKTAGLKPYESVTIITNIPADIRSGTLKAGTGHYQLVEDKDLTAALTKGLYKVKTFKTDFPAFVCVTTAEYAKSHPETLQAFTNGLYTAQLWMKSHTAGETAAALKNNRGLGQNSLPGLVETYYSNGHLRESPVLQGKDLEIVVQLLEQSKELPMPVNTGEMINNDFSKAALNAIKAPPEEKQERPIIQRLKFWD
ncbi:MAG: ABC transporter substrate-binding protein [Bacillota bacterium]